MFDDINYDELIREVGKCCLSGVECTSCAKEKCLIGYSKKSLMKSLKSQEGFIEQGSENIPFEDTKFYDESVVIDSMAFLLNQCRNCNLYHDEDCIVNIIRGCLEVILFGESMDYPGSALMYFSEIKNINKDLANKIYEKFNEIKKSNI